MAQYRQLSHQWYWHDATGAGQAKDVHGMMLQVLDMRMLHAPLHSFTAHSDLCNTVAWHLHDHTRLATGSRDGAIKVQRMPWHMNSACHGSCDGAIKVTPIA